jgi:hypothetical protein
MLTLEQIRAMSPKQRFNLYQNCTRAGHNDEEAGRIIALMVEHDLLVTPSGGFPYEHPVIMEIEEVIRSAEGRKAIREAADRGLPALAGVDAMIGERLGPRYGLFDTTNWAGTFVADEMRKLGYVHDGQKSLPPGSTAKSGAFFRAR